MIQAKKHRSSSAKGHAARAAGGRSRTKRKLSAIASFGGFGRIREIPLNELEAMWERGDLDPEQSIGYPPPTY